MCRSISPAAVWVSATALLLWVACGPGEPGFDDGEDPSLGIWTPSPCCCVRNIIISALVEGASCPEGFTAAPPDKCPGGQNYPNDVCDIDWKDAGGGDEGAVTDDGGADVADGGSDGAGFDAGAGFCCCNGPDVASPLDADGGLACPEGFNKITPDLCPGGANYPNGLCGT